MELLKQLYLTHSPSRKEAKMAKLIMRELDQIGIPYVEGDLGQIYSIHNKGPMVCAHMDQVQFQAATNVVYNRGKLYGTDKKGHLRGLGADDKNGIWICLNLIKDYPELNFIFSTCEEMGGNIQYVLDFSEELEDVTYCLVFDRKGGSDIISVENGYCEIDLLADLEELGMGFKGATGTFSDCDHLSMHLPCVNISCGYHGAHTTGEYTVPTELLHSLDFGRTILRTMWNEEYHKPMASVFDRSPRPIFYEAPRHAVGKWSNVRGTTAAVLNGTATTAGTEEVATWQEEEFEDYYLCDGCYQEFSEDEAERMNGECPYCSHGKIILEKA